MYMLYGIDYKNVRLFKMPFLLWCKENKVYKYHNCQHISAPQNVILSYSNHKKPTESKSGNKYTKYKEYSKTYSVNDVIAYFFIDYVKWALFDPC